MLDKKWEFLMGSRTLDAASAEPLRSLEIRICPDNKLLQNYANPTAKGATQIV